MQDTKVAFEKDAVGKVHKDASSQRLLPLGGSAVLKVIEKATLKEHNPEKYSLSITFDLRPCKTAALCHKPISRVESLTAFDKKKSQSNWAVNEMN